MVAEAGSQLLRALQPLARPSLRSCSSSKLLRGQGSDCSVVVVQLRIDGFKVWVGLDPRSSLRALLACSSQPLNRKDKVWWLPWQLGGHDVGWLFCLCVCVCLSVYCGAGASGWHEDVWSRLERKKEEQPWLVALHSWHVGNLEFLIVDLNARKSKWASYFTWHHSHGGLYVSLFSNPRSQYFKMRFARWSPGLSDHLNLFELGETFIGRCLCSRHCRPAEAPLGF